MTSIVLAFAAAFLFGLALVLAQVGLRYVAPLSGAAIAIPSSTALFICVAPFALADATPVWAAVPIFAAIGLMFPGTATYPLVTVVGSTLLLRKVEGGLQLALGVALTVVGVALLIAG